MFDNERMKRQLSLLDTASRVHFEMSTRGDLQAVPNQVSIEVFAILVLAARVEALEDMLQQALPTAGEGT